MSAILFFHPRFQSVRTRSPEHKKFSRLSHSKSSVFDLALNSVLNGFSPRIVIRLLHPGTDTEEKLLIAVNSVRSSCVAVKDKVPRPSDVQCS